MDRQRYAVETRRACVSRPSASVVEYFVICILVVIVMADREAGAVAALSSLSAAIAAVAPCMRNERTRTAQRLR